MATTNDVPKDDTHAQNALARQGLDGTSIERSSTQAVVLAEKAREVVRARIMQAVARPRDHEVVRQRILQACKRPAFAAVALYRKPQGKTFIVGPSVRFAEEALRSMGNLVVEQQVVYEDARVRTIAVTAIDLESNSSTSVEITIGKTVERRKVGPGQVVLGRRQNTYGDEVYIVEATEDEFAVKSASAVAKARRNAILQLVPGDLVDEARAQLEATFEAGEKAVDPMKARRDLVDYYERTLGVSAAQIAAYLGHPLSDATREEFVALKQISIAIHERDTTWAEVVEASKAPAESADANGVIPTPVSDAAKKVTERLAATKKGAAKKEEPAAPAAPAQPAKKEEPAPAQQAPAKPSVAPSAGLEDASAIIDAIEAATETAELDVAEKRLASHVEAGEIGTTHQARVRAALASARQRLGAGK